ncbi:MAG: hypothetical protein O7A03_08900 [Alphaproteobacteria bacterium]|nr:hypothetical protein [Alphaproteobacteria bacterium]
MKLNLEYRKIGWVMLAGLTCGAIVWGLSIPLTGFREPFDSPGLYYMTAMFVAGIMAALPAPRYWWAAVVGIFLGEHFYAYVMLPETRAWLMFGVVMSLLMLTWLPSALGAFSVYIVKRARMWRARRGT